MKWFKNFFFGKSIGAFLHKVSCPVCLSKFYMRDASYRCLNKACKKVPDTVIEEVFSLKMPPILGRTFSIPGKYMWQRIYKQWKNGGGCQCPACKKISHQHLCPSCHTALPADFWQYPTYLILLLGSEKSGKSAYLASLLKRLKNIAADGYSFTFDAEHIYSSPWQQPLFRYKSTRTGKTEAFFTFFEVSGESLETREKLHEYEDYFVRADGLFVFLDPATFPGVGGVKNRLSEKSVETLTKYLEQMKIRKKRKRFPPSAFIVTKLDLIMNLLPTSTVLRYDTQPKGIYDEGEGYQVSREVRGYLGTWSGPGLLQTIICSYFRDPYRFFATSSDEGKKEVQNYAPLRVEEAFLWLLQEMHRDKDDEKKTV